MDGFQGWRFVVLALCIGVSTAHDMYEEFDRGHSAKHVPGAVKLAQTPGNDYERFPDTYAVMFEHEGEPVHYSLVRDDRLTECLNPSVFALASFLPDDLMTDDNEHEFAYYHNGEPEDSESRTGFVLHRRSTTEDATLFGTFRINGQKFVLEHEQNTQHRVRRDVASTSNRARSVQEGTTNIIETFVWSAPDVFAFHRARLRIAAKRVEDSFLRVWEKALIKEADLIFRKLNNTDLRLYYVGSGNDRKPTITWYRNNVQGNLMQKAAVDDVTVYLKLQVASDLLLAYDHAVVLTRHNLAESFDGRGQDKIAYGNLGSICKTPIGSSVSLAEVSSPFFIKAIAQSIIFAFGVSYYFMGNPYSVMSRELDMDVPHSARAGRWTIDQVTAGRIQTKIDELADNCLLTQRGGFDETFWEEPSLGVIFPTMSEQCQIFAGSASTDCQYDASSMCYNGVKCTDSSNQCTLDYFTADTTSCGADLSCRYGTCIENRLLDKSTSTSTSTTTA